MVSEPAWRGRAFHCFSRKPMLEAGRPSATKIQQVINIVKRSSQWMRFSPVVRAPDCQCRSHNSPGFDPSILWHGGIWGATDEAVLNTIHRKSQKIPLFLLKYSDSKCGRRFHWYRTVLMHNFTIRIWIKSLLTNSEVASPAVGDFLLKWVLVQYRGPY